MFRDPAEPNPSAPPAYDARASVYPQQSLADSLKGSTDSGQRPDPNGAGYPQQSLIGNSRTPAAPAQQAYVPHPPGIYTPSQQPYVPPQGQQNYAPPPAQQNYVAPPQQNYAPAQPAYAPPRSGQQSYAAPPAQPAYAAPAAGATAAAAPPAKPDYAESLPYPKQSLADLFRGSTDTQTQTVPHPPAAYTPSNQPYSPPPGQPPAYGAPQPGTTAAAAPPPAAPNPADSLPYPKQSLFEIFSSK
jgi:hypothetical protein